MGACPHRPVRQLLSPRQAAAPVPRGRAAAESCQRQQEAREKPGIPDHPVPESKRNRKDNEEDQGGDPAGDAAHEANTRPEAQS